jgi:hypothetical protein
VDDTYTLTINHPPRSADPPPQRAAPTAPLAACDLTIARRRFVLPAMRPSEYAVVSLVGPRGRSHCRSVWYRLRHEPKP